MDWERRRQTTRTAMQSDWTRVELRGGHVARLRAPAPTDRFQSRRRRSTESNGSGADLLADADAELLPAANKHIDSAANGSAFKMK